MSLINVTNLTFAYDGSYENIFENASFQIVTNSARNTHNSIRGT